MKYPVTIVLAAALIAAAPQSNPTPPPAPPNVTQAPASAAPVAVPATPTPNPALQNLLGPTAPPGAKAGATPKPPVNARQGIDGVWEVQIQNGPVTTYDHMNLKQTGDAVTGTYLDNQHNKRYPLSGSVDGQNIRMVVSLPNGSTILMSGRLDGTTDMIGMYNDPKLNVPFTAAYRPKEKWINNLNADPGLSGVGGGTGNPPL